MKKNKNVIWIVVGLLAAAGVAAFFIFRKKGNDSDSLLGLLNSTQKPSGGSCVPYTEEMQKRDIQKARSKCAYKNLIPVVGQIEYLKCMEKEKSKLPPITNCY